MTAEDRDLQRRIEELARHVRRDSLVSEATLRRILRQRAVRERQDAKDGQDAEDAGTTVALIREARADRTEHDKALMREAEAEAARRVVYRDEPERPAIDRAATFDEIEAARIGLTKAGKSHGYDSLGGRGSDVPFPTAAGVPRRDGSAAPPTIPRAARHGRPTRRPQDRDRPAVVPDSHR